MVPYDTNVLALTDLPTGRIDAVVVDEVVANYQLKGSDDFVILDDMLSEEDYAIAFAKEGSDDIKAKVEAALDKLVESGKAAEISEKWFGKNVLVIE